MWIIAGYITVDEDQRDAYVEAHRDLVTRARQAPGASTWPSRPPVPSRVRPSPRREGAGTMTGTDR
jgi:hypothetical protein